MGSFRLLMHIFLTILLYDFNSVEGSISIGNDISKPNKIPAIYWEEPLFNNTSDLNLAYSDDHLEIYNDPDLNQSSILYWAAPLLKAWKFAKSVHRAKLFKNDQNYILYVILHNNKLCGGHVLSHSNLTNGSRNIIDCGCLQNRSQHSINNTVNTCTLSSVTDGMVDIVKKIVTAWEKLNIESKKKKKQGKGNLVFDWAILDILVYDVLITQNDQKFAKLFAKDVIDRPRNFPQEGINLFRNWYMPIYAKYGGSTSIQKLLKLLSFYGREGSKHIEAMTVGEFVHLWSQATGNDLRDLAHSAFGWIPDYRKQYSKAVDTFSIYNYSEIYPNISWYKIPNARKTSWSDDTNNGSSLLAYSDDHVAIYCDQSISNKTPWLFTLFSNVWSYAKQVFSIFGSHPILHIVIKTGDRSNCWHSKSTSYLDEIEEVEYNNNNGKRIEIGCEQSSFDLWNVETSFLDILLEQIASQACLIARETGNWPPKSVAGLKITDIIVYDFYLKLRRLEDAIRWTEAKLYEEALFPKDDTHFFRDWHYIIYSKYGKINAIKNFVDQMYFYWPRRGTDYERQFNLGEYVHFWSGAAGHDLKNLAILAFNWTSENNVQLFQARTDYPELNYSTRSSSSSFSSIYSTIIPLTILITLHS